MGRNFWDALAFSYVSLCAFARVSCPVSISASAVLEFFPACWSTTLSYMVIVGPFTSVKQHIRLWRLSHLWKDVKDAKDENKPKTSHLWKVDSIFLGKMHIFPKTRKTACVFPKIASKTIRMLERDCCTSTKHNTRSWIAQVLCVETSVTSRARPEDCEVKD
ncbi:hypothetical protein DFH06DRAFT_417443 [Mycena polygramma]|nr:hypothetical protein DFH06DRAFT_417443 [Mycena polygramma]